jgi:kynurenine formamidase
VSTRPAADSAPAPDGDVSEYRARFARYTERYCTWNRWGAADELGSANYITPQKVLEATRLVSKGQVFSLALPFDSNGPQTGAWGRTNPIHLMLQDGGDIASGAQAAFGMEYTDDAIYMPLQCGTQWDALAHIFHDGQMYNGGGTDLVTSAGAARNAITSLAARMVTRGVLLDVAAAHGKEWLDVSTPITTSMLQTAESSGGTQVGEGDVVLVRTGRLRAARQRGNWGTEYCGGPAPGLTMETAEFFCERHVAAVATDTWGAEVQPNECMELRQPLHRILIVYAGVIIGEMFDLEELASDCMADGNYAFLFAAQPLPITGAVGSPINPLAIK